MSTEDLEELYKPGSVILFDNKFVGVVPPTEEVMRAYSKGIFYSYDGTRLGILHLWNWEHGDGHRAWTKFQRVHPTRCQYIGHLIDEGVCSEDSLQPWTY